MDTPRPDLSLIPREADPDRTVAPSDPFATAPPPDDTESDRPVAQSSTLPLAPPGFEILGELGRGGMGVVYHARQTKLNREVALKMILAGGHSAAEDRVRFLAEAEAIAALNHPGIVQVYEFGTHAGQPFFALEYCPGGSLAKQLNGTPLPAREAASLVQKLAYAVHAAHEKGIVHRDLKPANVLLTRSLNADSADLAEKNAEAGLSSAFSAISAFKITDFGLAKRVEGGHGLTQTGAIMGTPSYMAPEQAGGDGKLIGPPTDVYALGAILYELLTGRPPFRAATPFDTILQVVSDDPVSVRQLQKKAPMDLETICHKCLHKDPKRRYDSTKELARDLGRWLGGESIRARPAGRVEKAMKWANRRPALAALTFVTFTAAAALIGGGLYFNALLLDREQRLGKQETDLAQLEQDLGTAKVKYGKLNQQARVTLARSKLILADSNWKSGDALGTLKALNDIPADLRNWEWGYQNRRALGSYMTLWGHTDVVSGVAFSPDGAGLASGSWDNTVRVWEAQTGATVHTLTGHTSAVKSLAFSPDGRRLASGSQDNTVRVWDAQTGAAVHTLTGHTGLVSSVAFSPDGARLASGSWDNTVRVWEAPTGGAVHTLTGHTDFVSGVAFSPDGRRLASGSNDDTVRLWEAQTGAVVHTLTGHSGGVSSVAFSPDGPRLASGSGHKTVRVWDANTGVVLHTLTGHTDPVSSVAFSPDGARLASGAWDRTVKIWDAQTGAVLETLTGHTAGVNGVSFAFDGRRLASASADTTIKVWNKRESFAAFPLTGHQGWVTSLAFNPDGRWLACSGQNEVKVWDSHMGHVLHNLRGHSSGVWQVALNVDGTRLATAGADHIVKVWDLSNGVLVQNLEGHSNCVRSVVFNPDGNQLASASDDGTVRLWDARTGAIVQTLMSHTASVLSVAYSTDGTRLASAGYDNLTNGGSESSIRIWDVTTGAIVQKLMGDQGLVRCMAFSPDGTRIAGTCFYAKLRIWDLTTGGPIQTFVGHRHEVWGLVFSPNGTRIVSGSHDGTVKIWDTQTGEAVITLHGNEPVWGVAFSPDGTRIASGHSDGVAMLWNARPSAIVQVHPGSESRDLSIDANSDDTQGYAIRHDDGTILLVKPLPPDEFELGYRAAMARPDPDWHWEQAQKYEKEKSWFAAAFHCEQVLKSRPDDAAAKKLLETARREWEAKKAADSAKPVARPADK